MNADKKTKIIFYLIVFFAFFGYAKSSLASCTGSGTTWNCPNGASLADVNYALANASDGATINFAAGNYTWNGSINIPGDRAVSLIGAGAGSSNVNINGGTFTSETVGTGYIENNRLYRFSGFAFNGIPGGMGVFNFIPNGGIEANIRIDHNTFSNTSDNSTGRVILAAGMSWSGHTHGNVYGSVDHNSVVGTYDSMLVKSYGRGWNFNETSSKKGTAQNIFVEDNTINFTNYVVNSAMALVDCWEGGSIVVRHNSITNTVLAAHEPGHGGGCLNFEAYNNTFTRTAGSGWGEDGTRLIHHQGSGEIFLFNNIMTKAAGSGYSTSAIHLTDYRGCPTDCSTGTCSALPECDGNQPIDGNWSPATTYYGYPCWRQAGRMLAGSVNTSGQPGTLSPVYVWDNYWSDTKAKIDLVVDNPWGCLGPPTPQTHLMANRDYYNAVSASAQTSPTAPFNGSTGMGFGTLANRPTTCTTNPNESGGGVGYFATDQGAQGTLYRCDSTNHWTVQYTPYTYPNPLASGSTPPTDTTPPVAPQGLSVQ